MNIYERTTLKAQSEPWNASIGFLVIVEDDKGNRAFGHNVLMKTKEDGEAISPTFSLSRDAAQRLMDDLWNCGIRPTEGTGSAGSLKATENHLEDMRKIVFDLLNRGTP